MATPIPKYEPLKRPGIVEIKPHNVSQIRLGLEQLADYRANRPGKTPYLLTYTYLSRPTHDMSDFTGYLLEPDTGVLKAAADRAAQKRKAKKDNKKPPRAEDVLKGEQGAWLKGLGTWSSLGTHKVGELPFGIWRLLAGPAAIGSMLEHQLRAKFLEAHGVPDTEARHLTRHKTASAPGPDIDFLEIAEMLYELEAALDRAA